MHINNLFKLVIAIAVSETAGIVGAFFTTPAISSGWYATLVKPALNPPSWVFGPVWTALYALMGISLFLVWRSYSLIRANKRIVWLGVLLFFVQLFLNAVWSIIFFGLHGSTWLTINNLGLALVDIAALWIAIVWTTVVFYKISLPSSSIWTSEGHGRLAAYLLLPYLFWVSFAAYLNYSIWVLN